MPGQLSLMRFMHSLNPKHRISGAKLDPTVGIRRSSLGTISELFAKGDEALIKSAKAELEAVGMVYEHFYCLEINIAEISAGSKVNPHFHDSEDEIYFILSGNGVMNIGKPILGSCCYSADWKQGRRVQVGKGDILLVKAGEVHSLVNLSGTAPLFIGFICSPETLIDGKGRVPVAGKPPAL